MQYLLGLLPQNSPYFRRITSGNPEYGDDLDVDLWAGVRNAPNFGAKFVKSFCEMDQDIPGEIYESHLWRLCFYKRYRNKVRDRNVWEACALTHYEQVVVRTIIECLLMSPLIKRRWISSVTGYSEDVIDLYHELFFNVRDRTGVNDDGYLLKLVFDESRQVEFGHNYHLTERWSQIARRVAYNSGIRAMLQWMGGRPSDSELSGAESMRAIESRIASNGRFAMNCGFQHQAGVVAISGARQLLQSSKIGGQDSQDEDATMGLTRLSMDQGAQKVLKAIIMAAADDRMRAAQIYDISIADQNKKLLDESKDKNQ